MKFQDKIALFPGSFDPFHDGHLHLIQLSLKHFNKIIVCVSNNENKIQLDLDQRFIQTKTFLSNFHNLNIEVIKNNGLTVDICKQLNIKYIIRGFRNKTDKKYEKKLKNIYKTQHPKIKVKLYKAKKYLNLFSSNILNKTSI